MKNTIIYQKEKKEDFFEKINQLTDKDQFTKCIHALENIPDDDRDYRILYQLARAYQNFAIIGDNDKGTDSKTVTKALLKSIDILLSIQEEGESKAEWNMRMAYGYQYLGNQEEKAISYALRWVQLDSSDEDALLVIEECKRKIEKRKICDEIRLILKEQSIKDYDDYYSKSDEELDLMEEKIHFILKKYHYEEEMFDFLDKILENDLH